MPTAAITAAYQPRPDAQAPGFTVFAVTTVACASAGLVIALLRWDAASPLDQAAFWIFAAGCVIGELFPVRLGRTRHFDQVTMSSAFALGILLGFGALPAMVVYVVASLLADAGARIGMAKALFNAGQYALALGAAAIVLSALGYVPDMRYESTELYALLAAAAVFFVVNHVLAGIAVALIARAGVGRYVASDLGFHLWTAGLQLAVTPVALVAVGTQLILVPLLSMPLVGIYLGARHAVDNAHLRHELASAGSASR